LKEELFKSKMAELSDIARADAPEVIKKTRYFSEIKEKICRLQALVVLITFSLGRKLERNNDTKRRKRGRRRAMKQLQHQQLSQQNWLV